MKFIFILMSMFILSACTSNEINTQQSDSQSNHLREVSHSSSPPTNKIKNNAHPSTNKKIKKNASSSRKEKVLLNVPIIAQNPELKYGCEVTSLAMVLQYAGYNVNKQVLANQLKKDNDRIQRTKHGDIIQWGDPNEGFVGDITGKQAGYAVFDQPMEELMRKYTGDKTLNLTGKPFDRLLDQLNQGKPVVVWTTGDYKMPNRWEAWKHHGKTVKTPLDLHAVVLVGYEPNYIYINDPLSGKKNQKVNKKTFIKSWIAMKKRALSYR